MQEDLLRGCLAEARTPTAADKVFKEESVLSFDTPWSATGLYTSLKTWLSYGEDHLELDHSRTGNRLYLHQKWTKELKGDANGLANDTEATSKPQKLAIGVDGGFVTDPDADKYTTIKKNTLVVMPERKVFEITSELPLAIGQAIDAILAHDDASVLENAEAWQEELAESKYARSLPQLDNGVKVPSDPNLWKCQESGTTENLWLNLSTGHIGSGRRNWDGSGGTGAALKHFEETGSKYPLAVKLGTITPHGADVYSYAPDENDMVLDPLLSQHLAHWGINMMEQQKTAKTMTELQIDLNMSYEFNKITESGKDLKAVTGAGLIGLENLGNSCYMNSVLQLLAVTPMFVERYGKKADKFFSTAPENPADDLSTQMSKVAVALTTDKYAVPTDALQKNSVPESVALKPSMFKNLVGRGHPEFSSSRQQDALEYFQHLLDLLDRSERSTLARVGMEGNAPLSRTFEFLVEERVQCGSSRKVRYSTRSDNVLSLDIPLDAATNTKEFNEYKERESKRQKTDESDGGEEPIKLSIPLSACLARFMATERLEDFYSSAINGKTHAEKTSHLKTMPPFLVIHLKRYYVADDWTPRKLDVLVDVDDVLDLEPLRSNGAKVDEEMLPEEDPTPSENSSVPVADADIVGQLTGMGFSENGSKRAALATGNSNAEAAMEWVLAHMGDSDFNDSLPEPSAAPENGEYQANPESLAMLSSMGFGERHAMGALKACSGNLERAADWLFSRADNLDAEVEEVLRPTGTKQKSQENPVKECEDGPGQYELIGFASHMGTNTACGHYVAHVKKDGEWILFNDSKVAQSQGPPKELGYLFLYKRKV